MNNPSIRPRLRIPTDDPQLIEWLDKQGNLSLSIRLLINNYIATYGATDVVEHATLTTTIPMADTAPQKPAKKKETKHKPQKTTPKPQPKPKPEPEPDPPTTLKTTPPSNTQSKVHNSIATNFFSH